jgi:HlyD family secretion protein
MDIQRPDLLLRARRRRLLAGLVGLGGVLALLAWVATLAPAAPRVPVASLWIDTVTRGELLREIRGPGLLVPREIRWIAAETAARVERIRVRPGAVVEADTIILELSNPEVIDQKLAADSALTAAEADYTARQMQLESQLLDQQAALAGIRADHEIARLTAEAEGELATRGIIPGIQARRSQLGEEQLKLRVGIEETRIAKFERTLAAQLTAERARIAQLRNVAELRQRQAEGLVVRAGIAGVLQQVPVQEGQQVLPGGNLARVAKPGALMAELRISETQVKDVVLGQMARVDTRNGIVAGRVVRIDPAVQNGAVLVEVDFDEALPSSARPDLSVDGTIEIERLPDVLHVGRPATGQPSSEVRMFRLDDDGHAHRVSVGLGRASVNRIEIVHGLDEGDRVILSDTSAWDDQDRLRLD